MRTTLIAAVCAASAAVLAGCQGAGQYGAVGTPYAPAYAGWGAGPGGTYVGAGPVWGGWLGWPGAGRSGWAVADGWGGWGGGGWTANGWPGFPVWGADVECEGFEQVAEMVAEIARDVDRVAVLAADEPALAAVDPRHHHQTHEEKTKPPPEKIVEQLEAIRKEIEDAWIALESPPPEEALAIGGAGHEEVETEELEMLADELTKLSEQLEGLREAVE